jgi:uncharacterized membrane protein YfcA
VTPKAGLFVLLGILGLGLIVYWYRTASARHAGRWLPSWIQVGIGALTDFLDTLAVGSFATTTSLYKIGRVVDDQDIPGTLNVGHALPTLVQAFIFIAVVDVEIVTLVGMIGAAVVGAFVGAGVVARWPKRRIQIGMGGLLIVAAGIIAFRQLGWVPGGGDARGVSGASLAVGMGGNAMLGALMTLGIGLYAPCMILVSLLGMSPDVALPIMMGSCAFLMPVASVRFIRSGRYDVRAALGLTLGGIPAVLVAVYLVKSLPVTVVRWLVVAVVIYTAVAMLHSAARSRPKDKPHA